MGGILGGLSRIAEQVGNADLYKQQRARALQTQDISDQIGQTQLRLLQFQAQHEGAPKTTAFRDAKTGGLQVLTAWPDGQYTVRTFGGTKPADLTRVREMLQQFATEKDPAKRAALAAQIATTPGISSSFESQIAKSQFGTPPASGIKTTSVPPEVLAQIGPPPNPAEFKFGQSDPAYTKAAAAWGAKVQKAKMDEAGQSSAIRGFNFYKFRPIEIFDAQTQQAGYVPAAEAYKNPGRYIPLSAADKARTKLALIEDIRGSINQTVGSINSMKTPFNVQTRAKLAVALADPAMTATQLLQSIPRGALTDEQSHYIIDIFALRENAMAMRSVLGAGQGSEDLRRAILSTLPGAGTPNKRFAILQLQRFEKTLDRLKRGVLLVPLNQETSGAGRSSSTSGGISMDDLLNAAGIEAK